MKPNTTLVTSMFLLLALATAPTALAQDSLFLLMNPEPNEQLVQIDADAMYYVDASADKRRDELGMGRYGLNATALYPTGGETGASEWILSLDVSVLDTSGELRLPRSRTRIPGELYDYSVGGAYRTFLGNGWLVGGQLRAGQATDEPFESFDEAYLNGLFFARIPHLQYNAWMLLLSADTRREWPVLPGVAYQFPVSKTKWFVIGVPVCAAGGKIGERIQYSAMYVMMTRASAKVSYAATDTVRVFAAYDWDRDWYLLADRRDSDDRFIYTEQRVSGGIEWDVTESFFLKAEGGYAFDRSFAEGEDDDEEDDTRLDIDSGWFAGLSATLRF